MLELLGTIEAAELPNGDYVVAAHGPLDERAACELRDVLLPLTAGPGRVVVDLADAHGIDARALAIVACAAQILLHRGARLEVVSRSPALRALLDESGIAALVELRRSLAEAVHGD